MVQVVLQRWLQVQTFLLLLLWGVFTHASSVQPEASVQQVTLGLPTDILNLDMQGLPLPNDLALNKQAVTVQAKYIELFWQEWARLNDFELEIIWQPHSKLLEMLYKDEIHILGVGDQVEGVERLYRSVPYIEYRAKLYERVTLKSKSNEAAAFHLGIQSTPPNTNDSYSILLRTVDADHIASYVDNLSYIYSIRSQKLDEALKRVGKFHHFKSKLDSTAPLYARAFAKPKDISLIVNLNRFVRSEEAVGLRQIWLDQYAANLPSIKLLIGSYSPRVTQEQERYLAKNAEIPYAYIVSGESPFFEGEDLFLDGYYQDIIDVIGSHIGFTPKPITFASRADAIAALNRGEVKFIPGIYFEKPELLAGLVATQSIDEVELSLVSRGVYRGLDELNGKVIAAVSSSNINDLVSERLPSSPILYFDTTTDALSAVADGRAKGFIGNQLSTTYILARNRFHNLNNISVAREFPTGKISLEVDANEMELVELLNTAIQELDRTVIDTVTAKWRLSVKQVDIFDHEEFEYYLWILILIFAGMTSFMFYHRVQVRKMTLVQSQLKQALNETEKAHQQAKQLAKAKTEFLAKMSHEIRTPMNGVLGMAEALTFSQLSGEQKDQLEVLSGSAYNLMSLLNDVLDFSKMEAGKMTLSPVPTELYRLLNQAAANFEFSAREKGVNLNIKVPSNMESRTYNIDPVRWLQVINNLLSNATKFTQEGFVEVSVETIESSLNEDGTFADKLRLQVRDSGIGLSKTQLEKLFRPFVQADDHISRRFGGSGLGLSICQEIVDAMDGKIEVSSIETVGTVFSIIIVAQRLTDDLPTRDRSQLIYSNLAELGLSILLVEDNLVNQKVLIGQLAKLGLECTIANNGAEGFEYYQQQHFDIVLSDCHMPVMDGIELAKKLNLLPKRVQSYLVVITADVFSDLEFDLDEVGFDGFISKPCTINDLSEVVLKANEHLHGQKCYPIPESSDDVPSFVGVNENWLDDLGITSQLVDIDDVPPNPIVLSERFNASKILELNGDDMEITLDVLNDFLNSYQEDMDTLKNAIKVNNPILIKEAAHKLKGVFMYLGCGPAYQLAKQIEKQSDRSNGQIMEENYHTLEQEVEKAIVEVSEFITSKSKG
ncbi:ATP-binding protein [Vibrio agarivorans]|uniref:ATP-binding protein n=1 Tax=Vibrio agarivorans TaxID=153622 RepID=UPI0025B539B7|nr:ATP-binding protein [Vibrio agarivorans]MDN3662981.1 ATP-binding protein [Vibrio agarivorans]